MSYKFGRIYTLKLETPDKKNLEISSPFTVDFSVLRNNLASANTASFTIYNLGEDTRKKIYKDQYDVQTFRAIQFFAGYEGGTDTVFSQLYNGHIKSAYSVRSGPDIKTEIECYDGAFAMVNAHTSMPINAGATLQETVTKLIADLKGPDGSGQITIGAIGNLLNKVSTRGQALIGNTSEILKDISGNTFYIDSGKAYILKPNEIIPGEFNEINSDSGILESPRRSETMIEVTMLFEPRIKISQMIRLNSSTEANFNGLYKVVGVSHRGTISGAIGGQCTTTVSLFSGNALKLAGL